MKKTLVQQIQPDPDGPVYGQVSNPSDFVKAEEFAHEHVEHIARDFLVGGCGEGPQVAGFEYSLIGGLGVRIHAPGHIVDNEGHSFDLLDVANVDLMMAAADANNPRVDLIYAKIEIDVEAHDELRPFIRLRTIDELQAGVAPYPPAQFTQPTELHTRATVLVRSGTPAAQPAAPGFNPDEAPLYEVQVRAGAMSLANSDVTDVRDRVRSLRCAWGEIDDLIKKVNTLQQADHRHPARKIDIEGSSKYAGKDVQVFIDDFALQSDETTYDPLLMPEIPTPELAPNHVDAGTLGSTGDLEGTTPVVDMPISREVVFSNVTHKIEPSKFPDSLNARVVNKHASAGTNSDTNTINFSLALINSVESDGGGDFELKNYSMPSPRSRYSTGGRLLAARDGRYIEAFGGAYPLGDSSWHTIDTVSGTVTQRAFSGDIPTNALIFAAPMGDGINLLLAERAGTPGSDARAALRWYKLNAQTAAATRFAVAPGTTSNPSLPQQNSQQEAGVIGDLIQTNVIFLLVSAPAAGFQVQYWIYHCDTNAFEQITPIGQGPSFYNVIGQTYLRDMDACFYQAGKAIVVEAWGSVKTFLFDYSTLTFTRLQISQPYSDAPESLAGGRDRLVGPTLANVGGRVLLVSSYSSLWELTPGVTPNWKVVDTALEHANGTRGYAGLAGLLSTGLPRGRGYLVGGVVVQPVTPKADIWGFVEAGIVETNCGGVTGLTLGGGATQASFEVAPFALGWAVGKLLVVLRGNLPIGSIKLSYSFDGGATWQDIPRDQITDILSSDDPATRRLRITLIKSGSSNPCLSGLTERFEKAGVAGFQLVLRYTADTSGVKGLYINRAGEITLESAIEETTPDKALLHKVTPQGPNSAPVVKDYIQQRLVHRKLTGTKAGGDPQITNRLPRRPRFIQAFKIVGGAMQDFADPAIQFDNTITITGLNNGESYRLEVQA